MQYHTNAEVNRIMVALADALCMWERDTGRRSTLILIPHQSDEAATMLFDGKPASGADAEELLVAIAEALAARPGGAETGDIIRNAAVRCLQVKFSLADASASGGGG